ncbi:MAG TPA: LTA synthase family protein [Nocardioides sp.]|nr:LTA synthase family protein [Nocardioides sp.]
MATSRPVLRTTFLLALGCNAALEATRLLGADGGPWRFKTPWFPLLFLLGTLVVWLLVGLVQAVTGRLRLTRAVLVTLTAVVAVVDHEKVRVREEPLYPGDLVFMTQLDLLAEMVGPARLLVLTVTSTVVALAAALLLRWHRGRRPAAAPAGEERPGSGVVTVVVARIVIGALCLLALVHVTHFNQPGNLARAAFDAAGAQWRPWNQQRNYLGNGFVAGVLYNTQVPPMAAPPGYSRAAMDAIVRRYAADARRLNRDRGPDGLEDANVVLVLSESLSDPLQLRGVTAAQDPLPFTRRLMGSATSGQLLVPAIGGGTANAEFEVLTGMSLALFSPQLRVPYQMLVPERDRFPSLVQWFESTGHRAVAMHPFTPAMYRRRDVYRAFGFDEFVHEDTLSAPRRLGRRGYVSDASAFDEAVSRLRGSEEPLLLQLVTMQNHMPYEGRYARPIAVRGPDGEPLPTVGQYLRGVWHSDRALRALVRDLRALPERTVLVVYGDHLPSAYPESVRDLNGWLGMRRTPFVVWSSFAGTPVRAPLVSPAHLADLALEHADAPVTPYTALLTRLRAVAPALAGGLAYETGGRPVPIEDLDDGARQLLRDYRLVQYDLAVGHGWSESGMLSTLGSGPTR